MGWWQIDADTLAGSRFVVSPLSETTAALKALHLGQAANPGEREWLTAHQPRYRERIAADPVAAALVRGGLGGSWNATFLTPTPERSERAFTTELDRIARTDPGTARADLAEALRGPLPPVLDRDDLPGRAADLLHWVWQTTVLPDWPRRRRIIESDILARTTRLAQGGWESALDGLRHGMRWLGASRLRITLRDQEPRDLDGTALLLVPVTPGQGWFAWDDQRHAIVYPAGGVLAEPANPSGTDAGADGQVLARLVGPTRARILLLLADPLSTTHLVAVTGQGLGSVGNHLRVLLDAGLLRRRRTGRVVLYARTELGEALVAGAATPTG
ncbi:helix-turn-helix domain-containing protein [Kitasatospora viridis]|uniref:Helix-turn-helix protein n=1 Tax=Kitasatospora viridis TaxID=281105 RepID=A0A561SET9_9ACTN|nr:helix-turn-helix domain-containing protein [Kitasatospora viridis]TWF73391.1 helix-turn-helix protein [Kitasatospora viridis]